jgi:hypothetical protein
VMAVASTPADCEPKEVTLLPLEVTAPLRLAFVVTVAALPPILRVEVETLYRVPLFAPTTPARVPRVGRVLKVVAPLKVFEPEKVLAFASSVVEAMTMLAAPVKLTPLMVAPGERADAVAALVEVAMNARPPVVLFQPRTVPPVPVPKSVEVAVKAGTPVTLVASTPADCEPKEVTLLPELVTAPERLALVVTVAALPVIEPTIGLLKVLVPLKVLEFASSVEEAAVMVMSAEPLKATLLMLREVVRVAAEPPMEKEAEEVATSTSAVPAAFE